MKCAYCEEEFHMHDKAVIELNRAYHEKCIKARDMSANGYPHECPACKGAGKTVEEFNTYPDGFPDSGWVYKAGYRDVECKICNGRGYNARPLKPKMVQQGWE